MSASLTQKQRSTLQDLQKHEEVCIRKYQENANKASNPFLQQLFTQHANQEEQHYQTLEQILNGIVPSTNQQGQQMQQIVQNVPGGTFTQEDAFSCNDLIMMEKFVSGTYDSAIYEFSDANIRQALNHIQKEEQQHGEDISNYMRSQGMQVYQ